MFELILMRHAKSDWNNNLTDKERTLNKRGIEDAQRMGKHLTSLNLVPDKIIISSSERTQQTAGLLLESFNINEEQTLVIEELYLASVSTMLELIKQHANTNQRLMVIAHNPGMDELVSYLAMSMPKLTSKGQLMVSCSVATMTINSLNDLNEQGTVDSITIFRPKEINQI